MNLYQLSTEYQQALSGLEESAFDEQTISDTLEGLKGELVQKGQNVLAYSLNLDAEADGLKEIEKKLALRRKAIESKSYALKNYLKVNMQRTGITEIKAMDNSFVVRLLKDRDESVIIDNAGEISCEYFRVIPESWEPDKIAIKKAINEGKELAGCHIEKHDRLVIK